ncbi:MAG: HlyD family secretion protein [Clostridia bacterium]
MTERTKAWLRRAAAALVLVLVAVLAWQRYAGHREEPGVASGNGRIEATQVDVASRNAGRVKEILVAEGDLVAAGQAVVRMDTDVLEASRRQAEAQLEQAKSAIAAARATTAQRSTELALAKTQLSRTAALAEKKFVSPQAVDDAKSRVESAQAALEAARAQTRGQESTAAAAQANIERIQADIDDSVLKSPRDGRIQYRIAQPGEVVGAGGRVLSLLDLSDVYMTFFLPTAAAGRLALGADARIILDAAPQYVIPAKISFVASDAQFTPKTVETASEREKLMFRVRAQIDPDLLRKHVTRVKAGLPGVAYVKLDAAAPWPERLQVKLPQ